jgi:predicted transcriptional regulator
VNNGLLDASDFAVKIGKGNFDTDFLPLSEDDVLGNALIAMRGELSAAKLIEVRRAWASEGLAQFSEIIRKHSHSPEKLNYEVLVKLIEYTEAIQGAVFLAKESDNKNEKGSLEMVACYAYDRHKYIDKKVLAGEGFVGQVFLEQEKLMLSKLPPDYSKVAIGAGEISPGFLLVTPIKVNQQTIGVLEIASIKVMEEYQIRFIDRICETLASSVASALASEKMSKLLEDAQIMAESLRSQEEEMRQNYEELLATQEELMRREKQQGHKKENNLILK